MARVSINQGLLKEKLKCGHLVIQRKYNPEESFPGHIFGKLQCPGPGRGSKTCLLGFVSISFSLVLTSLKYLGRIKVCFSPVKCV